MKQNMGTTDRIIRTVVAIIIAILYFTRVISGTLAIILGIIAALLLVTSILGWCLIYAILGISTKRKE